MLDYETLKFIWWILVGALLLGFAIMDGHDMGVGTLLPFVGRNDVERRIIINTVGPHWDGSDICRLASGLRYSLLRFLLGNVGGVVGIVLSPGWL